MKNLTLGQRIQAGFGAILVLIVLLVVGNSLLVRRLQDNVRRSVSDTVPRMALIERIACSTAEVHADVLRHLLATTPEEKREIETHTADYIARGNRFRAQVETRLAGEHQAAFRRDMELRDQYLRAIPGFFDLSRSTQRPEAAAYLRATLTPAYNRFDELRPSITQFNQDLSAEVLQETQLAVANYELVGAGVGLTALIAGFALSWLVTRRLNSVLSRVANSLDDRSAQVAAAASQISSASQMLAEGASQQAASLQQTTASLEAMAGRVQSNTESAQASKELASQTRAAAETGASSLQQMGHAIGSIKTSGAEMRSAMDAIQTASSDISKIVKSIDEIAFQTKILALNAAVEAARAGEAGQGFAVVADEVRSLAQRCAQAAQETSEKIDASARKSRQGAEVTQKVNRNLEDLETRARELELSIQAIVGRARQVDQVIGQIATASQEQNAGIKRIQTNVQQIDSVTQANAAGSEQNFSAAEELNSQAVALKQSVADLLTLLNGSVAGAPQRPAPQPTARPLRTSVNAFATQASSRQILSAANLPASTRPAPANHAETAALASASVSSGAAGKAHPLDF